MLKHCHATAIEHQTRRSRRNLLQPQQPLTSDTSSLNSSSSSSSGGSSVNCSFAGSDTSTSSSFVLTNNLVDSRRSSYSSPEPLSMASRASSYASLATNSDSPYMQGPRTAIKIYAKCLRSDIEYKTLSISRTTTSAEVIWMLLSKFKMRHRDPKLFHLTMDIGVAALSRTLSLDDDSRPAELKSCHPWGECKFTLQMKKGGLVRIHDSVLMAESKYKCLLISEQTTVREVITILFHCYGLERIERVDRYVLCEMTSNNFERRLHHDDCPASIQQGWDDPAMYQFVLKRNTAAVLSISVAASPASVSSGMSPSSTCSEEAMDTSYSTSSNSDHSPSPSPDLTSASTRSSLRSARALPSIKPNFNINGPVTSLPRNFHNNNGLAASIHEVGLPPVLRPKPPQQASLFLANGSRGNVTHFGRSSNIRARFHDYENYFYI